MHVGQVSQCLNSRYFGICNLTDNNQSLIPIIVNITGCEDTMKGYGYPWPSMLDCDKFPLDNDMCITSQAEKSKQRPSQNHLEKSNGKHRNQHHV